MQGHIPLETSEEASRLLMSLLVFARNHRDAAQWLRIVRADRDCFCTSMPCHDSKNGLAAMTAGRGTSEATSQKPMNTLEKPGHAFDIMFHGREHHTPPDRRRLGKVDFVA